jgi:hypothetical protein
MRLATILASVLACAVIAAGAATSTNVPYKVTKMTQTYLGFTADLTYVEPTNLRSSYGDEMIVQHLQLNYTAYSQDIFRVQIGDATRNEYRVPLELEEGSPVTGNLYGYKLTEDPFELRVYRYKD